MDIDMDIIDDIGIPKEASNNENIPNPSSIETSLASIEQVFAHKFLAPQSYPNTVIREHLLKAIFLKPSYGVVVIQAPAGHGKSTLLQQAKTISEKHKIITGWLNFDEADNDIRRFTVHMQTLINTLLDKAKQYKKEQVFSLQQCLSDWIASHLTHINTPIHLFFDEVQNLNNHDVLKIFRELLERIPDNVMIFISSRAIPEIGLARLIVSNRALVLHADDLRFAPQETELFFSQVCDLKINKEELNTIYKQTEGWPAALQLYRLSLVSPLIRQSLDNLWTYRPRELAEYLADNVLTLQSPHIQDFLLRTSILTRLSAALCDHITGWQNSQSILLFLERSGLFLRCLDPNSSWFQYHNLFSSFLNDQLLSQAPETFNEVHRRAAQWFYNHNMNEDAMHHATTAKDYQFATMTMNRWCDQLIADGYLTTVERWSDAIPLDEIVKHPELAIKISWALSFLRRHNKLSPILTALEQTSEHSFNTSIIRIMQALSLDDIPCAFNIIQTVDLLSLSWGNKQDQHGFYAFELAAAANVNGYRALCNYDFDNARYSLNLAKAYNRQSGAEFSGGYTVALLGMTLLMQGRLEDALSRYRIGLTEQHHNLNKSVAAAAMVACYTQALYEHNDLDIATLMFTQYRDMISSTALLDFLAVGYISMAKIHHAQGQLDCAENILDEAEELAHTAGWPRLARIVLWERVRCALMIKDIDRAKSLANRIPTQPEFVLPESWMIYSEAIEGDAISTIRLSLHCGEIELAASKLAQELIQAKKQNCVFRVIKLSILEAMIQQQLGATHLAQEALLCALQNAAPEGYIRVFLDEGESLLTLLRNEHFTNKQKLPKLQNFISHLLTVADQHTQLTSTAVNASSFQPIDPLTDREKNILIYLSNGISNKEIARHIFVSENTIKFHLKNIYTKLAVNSRLQAINAARLIGLVE